MALLEAHRQDEVVLRRLHFRSRLVLGFRRQGIDQGCKLVVKGCPSLIEGAVHLVAMDRVRRGMIGKAA